MTKLNLNNYSAEQITEAFLELSLEKASIVATALGTLSRGAEIQGRLIGLDISDAFNEEDEVCCCGCDE